ncbi:MAG: flagellar biosynthesis protein FlhB, partial [Burkholderiales bacterium]
PLTGLGRIFSKQGILLALKACLLAILLGAIGAFYMKSRTSEFNRAWGMDLNTGIQHMAGLIFAGVLLLLVLIFLFALIDVPLQKYLYASQLKMSFQEVKQEHKETEGSAEVKGKVRARMREMAGRRMLAAVPNADLVVMNPTHYAVALHYDEQSMGAPRVVAKGADLLALRIRDVAKISKVPVLQAPVLARALYAHARLDREIPVALFSAVAQVLAYVYQMRAAMKGHAPMPAEVPIPQVPPELDPHHGRSQ